MASENTFNFTETQNNAFQSYLEGKNIFITGPGGCGKSYFIQNLYKHAVENGKKIKVTSMTGCSAILLQCNATTLHKWGCLGLGRGEEHQILKNIVKMKKTYSYIDTDILVIDEISMLNEKLFETLDYLCKHFRKKTDEPFGGIQLICSGDFFQLPPVCKDKTNIAESNFCFMSKLWEPTFQTNCYIFDKNFRQHEDPEYFEILQEIREGKISFSSVEALVNCSIKKVDENDPIKPTKIYPIRKTVDTINQTELKKLSSKKYKYTPKIYHNTTEVMDIGLIQDKTLKSQIEHTIANGMFESNLELCEGCQVMCISNVDQEKGLVNGSQGIIQEFVYNVEKNQYYPVIQFDNIDETVTLEEHSWQIENNKHYTIQQLPLILSWAITTHKSQGLSITKALIDIGSNIFEYGQTYVALSRVKSLNGLYLTKVNTKKIKAHPGVIKFYNELKKTQ